MTDPRPVGASLTGRPNVLVIMSDQHRGDALSCADHSAVLTPTLDNLASEGVRFSNAYTTCPSCIAARRSFLSGQFPSTHGMIGYKEGVEWNPEFTLPGVFKDAGYQTGWVGRSMHQYPSRKKFGFDKVRQIDHRKGGCNDYGEWLEKNQPPGAGGYYGSGAMHNDYTGRPWHMDEGLHATNWSVNQALEFLDTRDPLLPFFLTVSFIAPHPPLIPPAFYFERYLRKGIPDPFTGDWAVKPDIHGTPRKRQGPVDLQGELLVCARAGYYGLINHIDDQIWRLTNPVNGVGRMPDRDTIIIYTSDHGEMLGDHYLWGKLLPYEPSAGIPFIVSIPGLPKERQEMVIEDPVCLEDIMPTLCDLAGIDIPDTVQGKSLAPLIRGKGSLDREYLHIEHAPRFHALTNGKKKYIWYADSGQEQFFDLEHDPMELKNLAQDKNELVSQWRDTLIKKLKGRPEGFTDGKTLIPGRVYPAVTHKE